MNPLKIHAVPGNFAVCQLAAESPLPDWAKSCPFVSVTRCEDELSIVVESEQVPADVACERDWKCMKLAGPFAFDQIGVIAGFSRVLADAKIGVFVISTFNTDYVLVKNSDFPRAQRILAENGYEF